MTNKETINAVAEALRPWANKSSPNSSQHVTEQAAEAAISAMSIRTMTVSEVVKHLCLETNLFTNDIEEAAKALAKLGTIRIVEDEK